MATLLIETFSTREQKRLLKKVRQALKNLCGHGHGKDGRFLTAPRKLRPKRDFLKDDYKEVWKKCVIKFDEKEAGASVRNNRNQQFGNFFDIRIGPFFLQPRFSVKDMEKLILHEYLHKAMIISMKEAEHGFIDQIIRDHLRYPGPPNIAEQLL